MPQSSLVQPSQTPQRSFRFADGGAGAFGDVLEEPVTEAT